MTNDQWTAVQRALSLAQGAHDGQMRKYSTGRPYIQHPIRVSLRIAQSWPEDTSAICAALLHDTLEDTQLTAAAIESVCGPVVLDWVMWLTNPSKAHSSLSRERRKQIDREHAARMPYMIQRIKLVDRCDNLREMTTADAEFKTIYLAESKALLAVIGGADKVLAAEYQEAMDMVALSLPPAGETMLGREAGA